MYARALTMPSFFQQHHHRSTPLLGVSNTTTTTSSTSSSSFTSKLLLLLTLLPLSLALLAFVLQWKGDTALTDPSAVSSTTSRWAPHGSQLQNHEVFPGMEISSTSSVSPRSQHLSQNGCSSLTRSGLPSFPYYRDWKLDFEANLKPKVCKVFSFCLICFWVFCFLLNLFY